MPAAEALSLSGDACRMSLSPWALSSGGSVCERQPVFLSLGWTNAAARTDGQQGPLYHMVRTQPFDSKIRMDEISAF